MSIKLRLVLLTVGVIFVVALITTIGYFTSRRQLVEQIEDIGSKTAALAHARTTALVKERWALLDAAHDSIQSVVRTAGYNSADIANALAIWGDRSDRLGMTGVYVAFDDGTYMDSKQWTPPSGYDPRTQEWYKLAVTTGDIAFSSGRYQERMNSGMLITTLVEPIKDNAGKTVGVVALDLNLDSIGQNIVNQNINDEGYGFLIDPHGLIMAHPNREYIMKVDITKESDIVTASLAEVGRAMVRGETGNGSYVFGKITYECFYSPLDGGWGLGVTAPMDKLMEPVRSLVKLQGSIGIAAVLLLAGILWMFYRSLAGPISKLSVVMAAIGGGDMTQLTNLSTKDELGTMARSVDDVMTGQREFFIQMREQSSRVEGDALHLERTIEETEGMANMISRNTRDLLDVAEENFGAVQNVNASIEELSAAATGAASAASSVSGEAEDLRRNAEESEELLKQNTSKVGNMALSFQELSGVVGDLDAKAASINGIVSTITAIADQTNLLALNAAIEAARAGEAGRGFAVVAEEVRKLAEESNLAAGKIGELAREIGTGTTAAVESAAEGVQLAELTRGETMKTQERLSAVILAVARIVDQIQSVAATSQEQSAALQEMTSSVDRVARGAVTNREKSKEIAEKVDEITQALSNVATTADDLRKMAEANKEHIARYRLDVEDGGQRLRGPELPGRKPALIAGGHGQTA